MRDAGPVSHRAHASRGSMVRHCAHRANGRESRGRGGRAEATKTEVLVGERETCGPREGGGPGETAPASHIPYARALRPQWSPASPLASTFTREGKVCQASEPR